MAQKGTIDEISELILDITNGDIKSSDEIDSLDRIKMLLNRENEKIIHYQMDRVLQRLGKETGMRQADILKTYIRHHHNEITILGR